MNKAPELVGRTFGRLVVIARAPSDPRGFSRWLVSCTCGNKKVVMGRNLSSGNSKSCGCLTKENRAKRRLNGKFLEGWNE